MSFKPRFSAEYARNSGKSRFSGHKFGDRFFKSSCHCILWLAHEITLCCPLSDPKYEWGFDDLGGVSVPVAMQANGTWKDPSGDNVAVLSFNIAILDTYVNKNN